MKITDILMEDSSAFGDGLGKIEMRKIGPRVILAGKNGAGKTRLLKRIKQCVPLTQAETIEYYRAQIRFAKRTLEHPTSSIERVQAETTIRTAERNLLLQESVRYIGRREPPLFFVPKKLDLKDNHTLTRKQFFEEAEKTKGTTIQGRGFGCFASGTFAAIQSVQDRWSEATHQNTTVDSQQRQSAISEYVALNSLICAFLGRALTRSIDGDAEIFGRRLGECELSDGQKVLLQFALAVHMQGASLHDLVVIMDEPENHLHPAALLEAISTIEKHLTNGQLWIATHSIPLIAFFDPASIWWMKEGTITYAGTTPRLVLEGLIGEEEKILKVANFLNLPFDMAATEFAYQSLFEPAVVGFKSNDPQNQQIIGGIQKGNKGPLSLLDYGTGNGRLMSAILEYFGGEDAPKKVDYVAYDVAHKQTCADAISRCYKTSDRRYYTSENTLLSERGEGSFDYVVMCNVLHEIPLELWPSIFSMHGAIHRCLKKDGFLLLVEDMNIPIGEKPHQKGFLVLDTPELRTLFQIRNGDSFSFSSVREGRLKAHYIPRECLSRMNLDSRRKALEEITHKAKQEIKSLRAAAPSFQNGRLHGFWVQQLANAQLCLEALV
jgi:energy-coupling factor transporter ATP-binding protein EcfA2